MKVVVTDYIEPDMNWEAGQIRGRGIQFDTYQLKFQPENEVLETKDSIEDETI